MSSPVPSPDRTASRRSPGRPPGARIVARLAAASGALTAILALIACWEIVPLFGGWPFAPILPLSGYYEWATLKALKTDATGATPSAQVAKAETATRQELRLSPMANDAWLRLAYIQTLKGPHLNASGVKALEASFQVAPLDPVNCGTRDILALNYWTDLNTPLRQKVLNEIRMTWKLPTVVNADTLSEWRNAVYDPSGRLALSLTLDLPKKS